MKQEQRETAAAKAQQKAQVAFALEHPNVVGKLSQGQKAAVFQKVLNNPQIMVHILRGIRDAFPSKPPQDSVVVRGDLPRRKSFLGASPDFGKFQPIPSKALHNYDDFLAYQTLAAYNPEHFAPIPCSFGRLSYDLAPLRLWTNVTFTVPAGDTFFFTPMPGWQVDPAPGQLAGHYLIADTNSDQHLAGDIIDVPFSYGAEDVLATGVTERPFLLWGPGKYDFQITRASATDEWPTCHVVSAATHRARFNGNNVNSLNADQEEYTISEHGFELYDAAGGKQTGAVFGHDFAMALPQPASRITLTTPPVIGDDGVWRPLRSDSNNPSYATFGTTTGLQHGAVYVNNNNSSNSITITMTAIRVVFALPTAQAATAGTCDIWPEARWQYPTQLAIGGCTGSHGHSWSAIHAESVATGASHPLITEPVIKNSTHLAQMAANHFDAPVRPKSEHPKPGVVMSVVKSALPMIGAAASSPQGRAAIGRGLTYAAETLGPMLTALLA